MELLSISIQNTTDMTPAILSKLVNRMDPDYRDRAVNLANRYKEKFESKIEEMGARDRLLHQN